MPGPFGPLPRSRQIPLPTRTVLLFALARAKAGQPTLAVDLAEAATVADLKAAMVRACPTLDSLMPTLRIAVDSEYADDDLPIPPGAELAAIPPVSGGSFEKSIP